VINTGVNFAARRLGEAGTPVPAAAPRQGFGD
jgi:hypothetical protein